MADHAVTGHVISMLACFVCTPAQICCCNALHNKMSWHQRGRYLNVTFCASFYNLSNRSSPHTMPAASGLLVRNTHNSAVPPRRKPQLSICAPAETLLQHVFLFVFPRFSRLIVIDATVSQLELTTNRFELMSSPLDPLNVTSLPCVPSSRDRTRGGATRRRGSIVTAKTPSVGVSRIVYDQAPRTMKQ